MNLKIVVSNDRRVGIVAGTFTTHILLLLRIGSAIEMALRSLVQRVDGSISDQHYRGITARKTTMKSMQ
jgi:hypothetical protein